MVFKAINVLSAITQRPVIPRVDFPNDLFHFGTPRHGIGALARLAEVRKRNCDPEFVGKGMSVLGERLEASDPRRIRRVLAG